MTTTIRFSQNGVLVNEPYKKEFFKYSFLTHKDNRYTTEQAEKDFFQMSKNSINYSELDSEENELEDIDYMLF